VNGNAAPFGAAREVIVENAHSGPVAAVGAGKELHFVQLLDRLLGISQTAELGMQPFEGDKIAMRGREPTALGGGPPVVQSMPHQELTHLQLRQIWPGVEPVRQAGVRDCAQPDGRAVLLRAQQRRGPGISRDAATEHFGGELDVFATQQSLVEMVDIRQHRQCQQFEQPPVVDAVVHEFIALAGGVRRPLDDALTDCDFARLVAVGDPLPAQEADQRSRQSLAARIAARKGGIGEANPFDAQIKESHLEGPADRAVNSGSAAVKPM
jgi:hypothetical protein